jgi:hypothetical protein
MANTRLSSLLLLATAAASAASTAHAQAPVVINEWMGRNETFLRDADGDFSDWLELHNTTDNAIDISGWRITIYSSWTIPDGVTIVPRGYLLLWASGKDGVRQAEHHMSFSIPTREWDPRSRAPEIRLSDAQGEVVFATKAREQEEDEAHGLVRIGDQPPRVMHTRPPTPGAANLRLDERPPWIGTPSGNSVLTSGDVTFDWQRTALDSAAEYFLDVAPKVVTKRGGGTIFSGSLGTGTSAKVSGIPLQGTRVYATLWTRVGKVWLRSADSYRIAMPE